MLGGASLEGDRGPIAGRTAQRRRLALLALLAAYRRGLSRDKLVGYLWEESDSDRARRVLSEAIYVIRKSLGEDAVTTAGDEVRLNPQVVWSDVGAFYDAIDDGRLEQAVELYGGPFLDGFYIGDALEFEQWAERERDRLARAYTQALQTLAERAENAADFRAAVGWWRKLVQHDKYAAAPTLGLMRALDAVGDRAGAIQEGRAHATRMRADLDAQPESQVEAFVSLLREAPQNVAVPDRVLPTPIPTPTPAPIPAPAPTPKRRRIKKRYIAATVVPILAIVFAVVMATNERHSPSATGTSLIAVMPFSAHGDAAELRTGLAHLFSTSLHGAGEFRAVDSYVLLSAAGRLDNEEMTPARAARFVNDYNADYLLLGNVVRTGNTVSIEISLYNARRPAELLAKLPERGPVDSVLVMVDRLSQRLLGEVGRTPAQQIRRVAAYTTSNYQALRAFWSGENYFRAGRYDRAADFFRQAVTLDPQFALAYYRLSAASEWNFEFLPARRAARRALDMSSRLPEPQNRLVTAWDDFLNGRVTNAASRYNNIRTQYPNDVEALSGLAEVLVHYNPIRGQPIDEAKRVFDRVLNLAPAYGEVRFHLLEFAARERNQSAFDSLYAGLLPGNPQRLVWRTVRAFTFGDARAQHAALAELDTASNITIGLAAGRIAAHTHNFDGAARVVDKLLRNAEADDWKAAAHILLAQLSLADGKWPQAKSHLEAAEPLELDWTRELSALYLLHPAAKASRDDFMRERQKLEAWNPDDHTPSTSFFFGAHAENHKELRLYLLGLVSTAAADTASARRYHGELQRLGEVGNTFARSLLGHIAAARGEKDQAVRLLESANITAAPELLALSPFYARAYDRFTLAQLTGNPRWKRSLHEGFDFVWARF